MSEGRSPLHEDAPHESGLNHTTGAAIYVDDMPAPSGTLTAMVLTSPIARGRIVRRSVGTALDLPGVEAVLFADDIPGSNLIGPIVHDEPLLAEDEVFAIGQSVALILATDLAACRAGAEQVEVKYQELPAILSIQEAIAQDSFSTAPHIISRGSVAEALENAALVLDGEYNNGGQDHFYLETQSALAVPGEHGSLTVYSSTQHPSEVQAMCAEVLAIGRNRVTCEVPRMGGAFGGKESQATQYGALAALGAMRLGRPVKLWLNRDQDMLWTGNRHPFFSRYQAGFDSEGHILGFQVAIYSDGGWTQDLSSPVMDRALFHLDNSYYIPNLHFRGQVARTNLASNTAFRGFGGPQGMLVIEDAMN